MKHFEIFTFNLVCSFPHCDQLSRGSLPCDSGTKIFVVRILLNDQMSFLYANVIGNIAVEIDFIIQRFYLGNPVALQWSLTLPPSGTETSLLD